MKVLLDHCLPKRLRTLLPGHDVKTARQMGWEQLKNGELLSSASTQFDVLLTIDKKVQFETNLATIPLAVVIVDSVSNAYPELVPFAPHLMALIAAPLSKGIHILRADGRVDRIGP
jgi:predicted nuclease of predicted toxin-antitoxin system